ncbi:hypothetical protein ACP4OV_006779 [Aristida adscensionis]
MDFAFGAARWMVGKALAPLADGMLEAWAASAGLGPNIDALKVELLYAQAMLNNARGRQIDNPALNDLLQKLQQQAYNADDVLDELDYFRIQDALDGTFHAAAEHGLLLNARHTARSFASKLKPSSSSAAASRGHGQDDGDAKQGCLSAVACTPKVTCCSAPPSAVGKLLPCCSFPSANAGDAPPAMSKKQQIRKQRAMETEKLKFDRVGISKKMQETVDKLRPICAKVSTVLNLELLGSIRITNNENTMHRPKTTPDIVEPELHGRDNDKKSVLDGLTQGKYISNNEITVVPIVGPGGIGKTTFTQYIYKELKEQFEVPIWVCVSLNFNANQLQQEIAQMIPKVSGEKENSTYHELIQQRLESRRFLIVLDDMWTCHESDWENLLAPFPKGREKGNVVIITTRIPEVAEMAKTIESPIQLGPLGDEDFLQFFQTCVFGKHSSFEDHPELHDVGRKIIKKLMGFPLAAKTVGRILRNDLSPDHWTRVLESKEWELQTSNNDIMPALKLSYDYLAFHLQQCFSYCALFPEDYEFTSDELIHLWIGLDTVHSRNQNKRIEDIGLEYLNELVNHGFFKKYQKDDGCTYYVVHDLLHNLAVKVSQYDCLSIYSSNVGSIQVPPSIRHLSIIVDKNDVKDGNAFGHYKTYLSELDNRLDVENLRTLMLFGEHHGNFAKIFHDLFWEARALRVIYLSAVSYNVEDILYNFSKLLHLRYLSINSIPLYPKDICLPNSLSRLYHLEVIDLQEWKGCFGSTRNMSKLLKLRHFCVPKDKSQLHSDILNVGNQKCLQELRRFEVRKEPSGFELSQLGQLTQLGGSLDIYNLQKVQTKEEVEQSKLIKRSYLHRLTLEWDSSRTEKNPLHEENILESLVPPSNLQSLCIRGHGGNNCPKWLGSNLSVKNLESLNLDNISWETFPPLGELISVNANERAGDIRDHGFGKLKRLKLVKISKLERWVGKGPCQLFAHLEVLIIRGCPELLELPFSHSTCEQQEDAGMAWFPRLRQLEIVDCPSLMSSLPPVPWTRNPCSFTLDGSVGSGIERLVYSKNWRDVLSLEIMGNDAAASLFWMVLAFDNLTELKELKMSRCPPLPLDHLRKLSSLKHIEISSMSSCFLLVEGESPQRFRYPAETISIKDCDVSGKELTQLLSYFPKLSNLDMWRCNKIKEVFVVEQQTMITTASSPASSGNNKMDEGEIEIGQNRPQISGEKEIVASTRAQDLLLLPAQLQSLWISHCPELSLRSNSLDDDREVERAGGGILHGLHSLRELWIDGCPNVLSSSSSSSLQFPSSLTELHLYDLEGMETLPSLSNLASLTSLSVGKCGDLRGVGLWPLIAQGQLTRLFVHGTPKFFVDSEPPQPQEQDIVSGSSKLRNLWTDDVAGFLSAPICTILSSSLTRLVIQSCYGVETFTKEQEKALQLLTSLQDLNFWRCSKLKSLPAGLHRLDNLKTIKIWECPAIRSLPKGGLPSSLQELDVRDCDSEELRRHCRKLIGTIPRIQF